MGRQRTEVERLRSLVLEQEPRAVAYAWAACLAVNLDERLAEITTPSLIIAGLHDLFTPPYLARAVRGGGWPSGGRGPAPPGAGPPPARRALIPAGSRSACPEMAAVRALRTPAAGHQASYF